MNEAYAILRDKTKRKEYDESLNPATTSYTQSQQHHSSQQNAESQKNYSDQKYAFHVLFSFVTVLARLDVLFLTGKNRSGRKKN